jgi:predicted RNA-binding Zn-ribbon protein involved in translation (DUF1610 family)
MACHSCGKDLQCVSAFASFCSPECERDYWHNPVRFEISSSCPKCGVLYHREVYSVEFAAYQALVMCPRCGDNTTTTTSMVGLSVEQLEKLAANRRPPNGFTADPDW